MKVKIYIFESVEDVLAFEKPEQITLKVEPLGVSGPSAPVIAPILPKRKYKKRKDAEKEAQKERILAKAKKQERRGTGLRHCKICGKPGHRSDGCRERREPLVEQEADTVDGRTDEQLHAAVQGLKEDGYDALRVAAKLKITLQDVHKFWE